ncbi:hypothetical protein Tco_0087874 [Tanacetum coccineum]
MLEGSSSQKSRDPLSRMCNKSSWKSKELHLKVMIGSFLSIGWEGDVVSGRLMLGLFDAGTEVSAKVVRVSCREGEDAGDVSGVGVVVIVVPAKVAYFLPAISWDVVAGIGVPIKVVSIRSCVMVIWNGDNFDVEVLLPVCILDDSPDPGWIKDNDARIFLRISVLSRLFRKSQLPLPQELTSTIDLHQNNLMANVNAPVEQALALAPPTRTDEQILPRICWVPKGEKQLLPGC